MHLTEGKSLIQSFPFSISWIEMNDKKESNPKLPASKKETMMIHLVKLLKIWKDSKIWYPEMNEVAWRKEFKPKLCFCSPTDWDKWRKIQSFPSPIRMTDPNDWDEWRKVQSFIFPLQQTEMIEDKSLFQTFHVPLPQTEKYCSMGVVATGLDNLNVGF